MKTLREAINPTVILRPSKLADKLGLDLHVATETFQVTGSFKFRAAYNLATKVPNRRLLTASSGNFGQALACAARITGKECVVVMPSTSAKVKIDAVRSFGATVDLIDTKTVSRSGRVAELAAGMEDVYVASPYDDKFVIEGNSSLADEIAPLEFDAVVVPIGGGGLISGIIEGLCRLGSLTEVVGAEPKLANDAARSLASGVLTINEHEPQTIADGARTLSLGKLNWEIVRKGLRSIVEVDDEKIVEAAKLYFELANLKSEPTGALGLGAILAEPDKFRGRKVCAIVSGGNVDAAVYREIIAG